MLFGLFIILAAGVFAYWWAGVCIRKERAKDAEAYGDLFGPVCDIREQLLKDPSYGEWFG